LDAPMTRQDVHWEWFGYAPPSLGSATADALGRSASPICRRVRAWPAARFRARL